MHRGLVGLVAISAALLSACSGAENIGSPAQQLSTWVSSTALVSSTAGILKDFKQVNAALGSKKVNAVQTTCSVMANDADAANSNLPGPNAGVATLLSEAYSQVGLAANACFVALSMPPQAAAWRSHQHQARALFVEASAIIESVTGHSIMPLRPKA
jgi:hypothetical protein